MRKKQFNKFSATLILMLMSILWGCGNESVTNNEKIEVRANVLVIHPSNNNITEYINLNGVSVFQKKDNIRSTNTGYVTSLRFKEGDYITKGQLFCNIVTKEQDALRHNATLDSSLVKFQLPLSILANASGSIAQVNALQGDYISEGDILAVVSEPASLIVKVNVPYEYNHYVSIGKTCEIRLPDGKEIHTTISGVMPSVDAISQSQTFYIRLPNNSIPENLNVVIRIPVRQKNNILCVPSDAVQTNEMQKEFWLMKVTPDSLAVKVFFQVGLQNDTLTEIISPSISITDNIILQGAYGLDDSTKVLIDNK